MRRTVGNKLVTRKCKGCNGAGRVYKTNIFGEASMSQCGKCYGRGYKTA